RCGPGRDDRLLERGIRPSSSIRHDGFVDVHRDSLGGIGGQRLLGLDASPAPPSAGRDDGLLPVAREEDRLLGILLRTHCFARLVSSTVSSDSVSNVSTSDESSGSTSRSSWASVPPASVSITMTEMLSRPPASRARRTSSSTTVSAWPPTESTAVSSSSVTSLVSPSE